jgi:hypothetical protein
VAAPPVCSASRRTMERRTVDACAGARRSARRGASRRSARPARRGVQGRVGLALFFAEERDEDGRVGARSHTGSGVLPPVHPGSGPWLHIYIVVGNIMSKKRSRKEAHGDSGIRHARGADIYTCCILNDFISAANIAGMCLRPKDLRLLSTNYNIRNYLQC